MSADLLTEAVRSDLVARHGEPHRRYHTIEHVQEVLAEYLAKPHGRKGKRSIAQAEAPAEPSAIYRAFEALGLIGAVGGVGPADNAGVRATFDRWAQAKRRAWAAVPSAAPKRTRTKREAR